MPHVLAGGKQQRDGDQQHRRTSGRSWRPQFGDPSFGDPSPALLSLLTCINVRRFARGGLDLTAAEARRVLQFSLVVVSAVASEEDPVSLVSDLSEVARQGIGSERKA